jgi:hypothetical protein
MSIRVGNRADDFAHAAAEEQARLPILLSEDMS